MSYRGGLEEDVLWEGGSIIWDDESVGVLQFKEGIYVVVLYDKTKIPEHGKDVSVETLKKNDNVKDKWKAEFVGLKK